LRYRQENSSQYVSGTVISTDKDGSRFIDSHHPATFELNTNLGGKTIFSGTKGALNN